MNPIGGYFELELPRYDNFPVVNGNKVNSGRNALEYILRSIGSQNIKNLYVPLYTCEVVLEPILKLGINFKQYHINRNLEIEDDIILGENDYIIVNNYFGIKDEYIDKCIEIFGEKIIIDSSQALFYDVPNGIKIFYSPRKFVSLPDGGIAKTINTIELLETDQSHDLCSHMLKRIDIGSDGGYDDFQSNSRKLKMRPLRMMSRLTERLISSINFGTVQEIRINNYNILRESLEHSNLLKTPLSKEISCPMVYPFLSNDITLRTRLIENKVYVAQYWPNIFDWCKTTESEYILANKLLPLPIDQRYESRDMKRIIQIIVQK